MYLPRFYPRALVAMARYAAARGGLQRFAAREHIAVILPRVTRDAVSRDVRPANVARCRSPFYVAHIDKRGNTCPVAPDEFERGLRAKLTVAHLRADRAETTRESGVSRANTGAARTSCGDERRHVHHDPPGPRAGSDALTMCAPSLLSGCIPATLDSSLVLCATSERTAEETRANGAMGLARGVCTCSEHA